MYLAGDTPRPLRFNYDMPPILEYTLIGFWWGEIQSHAIICSSICNILTKYLPVVLSAGESLKAEMRNART
jgi:hypothetical protein